MQTLVLDNCYTPIGVVSWQRAMTLWAESKIEVVEVYEDSTIRSVTLEFKMPAVIRFLKSVKRRKPVVKFSRENVYARDGGCCQYCGTKTSREKGTYDHVIPRSKGGKTEWNNIVWSCYTCNQKKASRTPEQAGLKLKSPPTKPTKLPEGVLRLTLTSRKDTPSVWRDWLASIQYWNDELDSD